MTHRILVVDDESGVRELLSDIVAPLGFEVDLAPDGASGASSFAAHPADLVFLDFLLPRGNGFSVAESIRGTPGGADVPIVMLSGVFKNPKTAVEAREKYRVIDFLSKPLDPQQILSLVRSVFGASMPRRPSASGPAATFSGRPVPDLLPEGRLADTTAASLFAAIAYDRSTGILDLTAASRHRRVYFVEGRPTFMQSNSGEETVGELLLRRGRINREELDRCRVYMKERQKTLQQSLLELRLVAEAELATAYKLLAGQMLPRAVGMCEGRFAWRASETFVGRVPEGVLDAASVLFQGIRDEVPEPSVEAFFLGRDTTPLLRADLWSSFEPAFRRHFPQADRVLPRIDGRCTYRQLLRELGGGASAEELTRALYAATVSGMVAFPASAEAVELGFDEESFSESDHQHLAGSGLSDDTVRQIESFYAKLKTLDHFELLGVTRSAPPSEIKAQYLKLARTWHMDSFPGIQASAAKTQLEEIFHGIKEAYSALTDPSLRGEYLAFLDRKSQGLSTDVAEVLRGEALYDDALVLLRKKDFKGAQAVLEEAIALNPDPNYFASLGWVIYRKAPSEESAVNEGLSYLRKAIREQPNLPLAYQYLGSISFGRGAYAEAKKWWQRCIQFDPDNIDANRGLRMAKQRESQSESRGGLMQRFRSRK